MKKDNTPKIWFEVNSDGMLQLDSIDPRTGAQAPIQFTVDCWKLMTAMLAKSCYDASIRPKPSEEIPDHIHEEYTSAYDKNFRIFAKIYEMATGKEFDIDSINTLYNAGYRSPSEPLKGSGDAN